MTVRAQGPDGTVFEFPDGTDEEVVSRTVRDHYAPKPTAPSRNIPAPQQSVAPPRPAENIIEGAGNFVTQWGDTRTRAQRGVGEVNFASIPENPRIENPVERFVDAQRAANAIGWGMFWNRGEADRANIIRRNVPTAEFRRDEFGNLQVRYRNDRPWLYINRPGGSPQDVLGGAGDMAKFAPAAKAGIAAQGAARAAGASGVLSSTAGASASGGASAATEAASRAASVPVGGSYADTQDVAAAGAGGAAGHYAGNIIALGARRLMTTPDQRAAEIISRRLSEGGVGARNGTRVTGDEALREVERRAARVRAFPGRTAETVAEVSGTPGQSMARAVANVPGPGKEIARNAVESRATGRLANDLSPIEGGVTDAPGQMNAGSISSRVLQQARGALAEDGGPKTFSEAADLLDAEIRDNASRLYGAARATPIDQTAARATLLPHMRQGPGGVLASAERQLSDEVRAVKIQIDEARVSGSNVNDLAQMQSYVDELEVARAEIAKIANGADDVTITPLALEYYQKGLSQAESALAPSAGQRPSPEFRQVAIVRENFNRLADRVAPALGQARSTYAHGQRVREAMEQGRKVFEMRPEEVTRFLNPVDPRTGQAAKLSKDEFQGFMYGALDEIERRLQRNETVFVLQFLRNRGWQDALNRFLGKNEAKALRSRLAREAGMQRFRNYTQSGSQTTPLAEDIKAMTDEEPALDFLGDVATSGGVQGPITRRLADAYQRLRRPGIYNESINRAIAGRLYSPATKGNIDALMADARSARLYQDADPAQLRGMLNRLDGVRKSLSARAASAPSGRARRAVENQIARLDEIAARVRGALGASSVRQAAPGVAVSATGPDED